MDHNHLLYPTIPTKFQEKKLENPVNAIESSEFMEEGQ